MASTNLQKAQIVKVDADVIYVKHPDLSDRIRTQLTASIDATGTAMTVKDNDGWADNNFMLVGYPGDSKSEEIDVNGVPTRGTSLTVTNTLKFNHGIDTPITRITEREIRIKGADTLTGSQTAITGSPFAIDWSKNVTECVLTSANTTFAFYFAEFSDKTLFGPPSDAVASTSITSLMGESIIQNGLRLTGEEVGVEPDSLLTRESLLEEVNNWQDDVASRRDWSHELSDGTFSSTEGVQEYAISSLTDTGSSETAPLKHPNANKGIVDAKLGKANLFWIDWHQFRRDTEGQIKTEVASAISSGDTSITLDNTFELADTSGSVSIGSDEGITYTGNDESTGVLSGILASGTGSIATSHAVDDPVWQAVSYGQPDRYTIYNDQFWVTKPVNSTNAGRLFKLRYYKKVTRLTDLSDTTDIPFAYLAQYFVASRIEYAKGNHDRGDKWMAIYEQKITLETKKDRQPTIKKIVPIGDDTSDFVNTTRYRSTESSRFNTGP